VNRGEEGVDLPPSLGQGQPKLLVKGVSRSSASAPVPMKGWEGAGP